MSHEKRHIIDQQTYLHVYFLLEFSYLNRENDLILIMTSENRTKLQN